MENVPISDDGTDWSPVDTTVFAWGIAIGIGAGAITKFLEWPAQTCPGYKPYPTTDLEQLGRELRFSKCNFLGQPVAEVGELTFLMVAVVAALAAGFLMYLYRLWDHNRNS